MDQLRKILPVLKPRKEEAHERLSEEADERLSYFCRNGSSLMVELISSFGGRYKLPIRSFSAVELIKATKNFPVPVYQSDLGNLFRGDLGERPVLVQFYNALGRKSRWNCNCLNKIIRDIVITSQMSHLKNVMKLVGCCLEFEYPAMVYDYAPEAEFLSKRLHPLNDRNGNVLSWRSRIKVVNDITNVLVYLHTAFPTPIIFRDLNIKNVIIDRSGVAKLFQFAYSISLPPGKFQVVSGDLIWTFGYIDPEYARSLSVTLKTDVYSLGLLMLILFTGETEAFKYDLRKKENIHIRNYVKSHLQKDQINQIMHPSIFEESNNDLMQHWLAFLYLALRCTEDEGKYRPHLIDVAKELRKIEKSVRDC